MSGNENISGCTDEEYFRVFSQVLGDEEHVAIVTELLQDLPDSANELLDSGELTLEDIATLASLVVSKELTDRHFGASRLVGQTAIQLLPKPE